MMDEETRAAITEQREGAIELTPEQIDALTSKRLEDLGLEPMTRGPRAGGVLPSPGQVAQKALDRVVELEARVAALEKAQKTFAANVQELLVELGGIVQDVIRDQEALEARLAALEAREGKGNG